MLLSPIITKSVCLLLGIILYTSAYAEKDLYDAAKSGSVSVTCKGKGGYEGKCLALTLKNNSRKKQEVSVDPGTIFRNKDEEDQNLIIVKEEIFILASGQAKTLLLQTMCIESHDGTPDEGDLFALDDPADDDLKELCELINRSGYFTSTAQSAVWAISDGESIRDIFGMDIDESTVLVNHVSEATGQPVPETIEVRPHHIQSIKGVFTYQAKVAMGVSFGVYDTLGNPLRILAKDQPIRSGLNQFRFVLNKVDPPGTRYLIRLTDTRGNVLKEAITDTSGALDESGSIETRRVYIEFMLRERITNPDLGVYDEAGNLVQDLQLGRMLMPGMQNLNFNFSHTKGKNAVFYVRLKNKGKLVEERVLRPKPANPDSHEEMELPIKLEYMSRYPLPADCKIYDEWGEELVIVFENKKLKAGKNTLKYTLKHRRGIGSIFLVKITYTGKQKTVLYRTLKQN